MSIHCVIPAYGVSEELTDTVRQLLHLHIFDSIVVVDDGNSRDCDGIFSVLSGMDGVAVLCHEINQGKGAALKTAFSHLLAKHPDLKGAVTVDADGQHSQGDVMSLTTHFAAHDEKLLLGSRSFRDMKKDIPLRSRVGNLLTEKIFFFFAGRRISDTQTGLRAYPAVLMAEALKITANRFEFELEVLFLAGRYGIGIEEVPIETIYVGDNNSSHFHPLFDSMRIYFVFLRFISASLIAAAADYIAFALCILSGVTLFRAFLAARLISLALSFILAKEIVFRADGQVLTRIAKFILLAVVLFSFSYASVYLLGVYFTCPALIAKLVAESLLFIVSFTVQKYLIFNSEK